MYDHNASRNCGGGGKQAASLRGNCRWLIAALTALLQLREHLLCDFLERLEHAHALEGYSLHHRLVFLAQFFGESVHRQHIRQIALVQLQDVGNLVDVVAVFFQVGNQVIERLDVGVHALLLGIGHEYDAVHSAEDQFAAGVIKDLSRNRVQVNARLEAPHCTQIQRQEIEKQGSISLGGQRDHLPLLLFGCFLEDELQIRRLTAQPGAVIDDLAVDLACCEVDETQKVSSETPAKKTLANHSLDAPASRYKSTLTTVSDTAGFCTTPEGPGPGSPPFLNPHEVKYLAAPLAIAASAGDNIRASRTPSPPDAAPLLRSRGSHRCPPWGNNPARTDFPRLRSPARMPARCRLAPSRCTPCRLQWR